MKYAKLSLLIIAAAMISACGPRVPPRTASDGCLVFQRMTAQPAPEPDANDVGNQWDTDETFNGVLLHNETWDKICLPRPSG